MLLFASSANLAILVLHVQ